MRERERERVLFGAHESEVRVISSCVVPRLGWVFVGFGLATHDERERQRGGGGG